MDLRNPVAAVVPGVQGKVLQALLGAGERSLSTSDVARVAGVSQPQASRVLARLAELGLLERTDVPPAVLYRVIPENAVIASLGQIWSLRRETIERMRTTAQRVFAESPAVTLFGSFARGDDDGMSDVDVLVVKPSVADPDAWEEAVHQWASAINRFCGSEVNVLEIDEAEWQQKRSKRTGVFAEIRRDGIDLLAAEETMG